MKNKLIFISFFIALFMFFIIPEVYGVEVYVKTSKKTTKLQVEADNTVLDIKEMYKEKNGVETDRQILIFSGNVLENERTVADCGMQKNSIINISIIDYELTNISKEIINNGTDKFSIKMIANEGYYMSDNLNVYIDNVEATTADFAYSKKTGVLEVPVKKLKDSIKIKSEAYKKYKVTFDANGGNFSDASTQKFLDYWDQSAYSKLEKPTKEHSKLKGYYTEKSGGTTLEAYVAEAGIDGEKVFYAQWEDLTIYKAVSGDNGTWDGTGEYAIVTSSTESAIKKVEYRVKGEKTLKTLTKGTDYTIESATNLVLTEKFFKKLEAKEYELYVNYANGYTPITFKVASNATTNDENKTTDKVQQSTNKTTNKTTDKTTNKTEKETTNTTNTSNTTKSTNTPAVVKNPQTGDSIKFVFTVLLISITLLFVTRKFEKNI